MKRIICSSVVLLSFFFSHEIVLGQHIPSEIRILRTAPEAFEQVAARVTQISKGGLSLLRTHEDGSAHTLIGNVEKSSALFEPSSVTDKQAVSAATLNLLRSTLTAALSLPAETEWREESTVLVENTWASSYSVSYHGIPLRERFINITTGALNGKVMLVRSNIPLSPPNVSIPLITGELALQKANDDLLSGSSLPLTLIKEPALVNVHIYQTQEVRLCYELEIREGGIHDWRYTYDAVDGRLIEKKDMNICNLSHASTGDATFHDTKPASDIHDAPVNSDLASPMAGVSGTISANVHLHSSFDTLVTVPMQLEQLKVNSTGCSSDTSGAWTAPSENFPATITAKLNSSYQQVFRADGGANASLSKTFSSGPVNLLWDDTNSDPAERDAYYSVAKIRDHDLTVDKSLTTLKQKIKINVNLNQTCNAFYNAQEISLNFFVAGGGCTNTAEISDVVYHEFGHRVAHARYASANAPAGNIVDGSLGEGFADLNSTFARSDSRIGLGFFGKNTTLRNVDNKNIWPKSVNFQDPHINGLMIAGAFWDVGKLTGVPVAEHIFHFCMYQKPDGINVYQPSPLLDAFTEVLLAALVADDDNNNLSDGTPHASQILRGFQLHNIGVPQFMNIRPQIMGDYDSQTNGYPVSVKATYTGPVGSIDKSSVKIHYSFDGKTYSDLPLSDAGNDLFTGTIPQAPGGTVVKYYASAGINYTDVTPVNYPAATEPLAFLVGFTSRYHDDCENDNGWTLSGENDINTFGGWTREVPYGTFLVQGQFIQQDTDHTANGTFCYLTGNSNAGKSRDPQYDCVDTGKVTLTTGTLDLSAYTNPYIRYWYYFRNDEREITALPTWTTQISSNDGSTFKNIASTSSYTQGWFPTVVRLKDLNITATAKMKLRFVPNNTVTHACVEAGVDDIEVLEAPSQGVSDRPAGLHTQLGVPYPNPASGVTNITVPFTLAAEGKCSLTITDILGKTIYRSREESFGIGNNSFVLSPSLFPSDGVYTASLAGPDGSFSQKISILHEK